jgi:hypothetical protein
MIRAALYDRDARFLRHQVLALHDPERPPKAWTDPETGRVYELVDQVAERAIYRERGK